MELEDDTDTITALIMNTSELININFVNDEVVCVIGKLGKNDLVYVEDIIQPDVPIARTPHRSELPLDCLFMSDIHNGSTTFLHDAWDRFIKWLNGKYIIDGAEQFRDRLKYIIIAGDVVDGIGVYPDQELELEILDIYAQYEDLAAKFQEIPEHIQLIVLPGNHDAVRPAEPQPTFPNDITKLFSNDIKFVGNPCYFSINNVEILAYHGRSMDDFVMNIPEMSYNKPVQIMKEMLVRRHLAPMYGEKTPIAPEHQDYLTIDRIPDFFITGHVHKTAVEVYRDISLINASAWQAQTSYQKMRNFNPDPAKVILADLQSRKIRILSFN
jgi:DNA polymerase II small subunit